MLCALLKCLHSAGLSLIRCSREAGGKREEGRERGGREGGMAVLCLLVRHVNNHIGLRAGFVAPLLLQFMKF